jgi:hypothetical protein
MRLYYAKEGRQTLLNDFHAGDFLHDLYNAE